MNVRPSLLDSVAIGASFACMLHCLAMPILLAALPTIAHILNIPESFHLVMLSIAVPTSALALTKGYRTHRSVIPVILGLTGIMLLSTGALWQNRLMSEMLLTVLGSITLAITHVSNWQLIERSHHQ